MKGLTQLEIQHLIRGLDSLDDELKIDLQFAETNQTDNIEDLESDIIETRKLHTKMEAYILPIN